MDTYAVYRKRDEKLRKMGFDSYSSYMASSIWKAIRLRVLKRDKRRCVVCGGVATQVHHRAYTTAALKGTCLKAMKSVCNDCHKLAEVDGDRKTHISEANRVIPSGLMFCGRCRKNPTRNGAELCGRCKRETRP